MTETEQWLTVLVISLGLILTRFIVFWIFPPSKKSPAFIAYLGKVLPAAAIALILVYSLKDVAVAHYPHGILEASSILVVILVHKWRRNTLLSIISGTVIYMVLIQTIF